MMTTEEERLLKFRDVLAMVSFSRNKIELMLLAGTFPAPFWIGPKSRRWRLSQVQEWIEGLSTAKVS